jgi:hypothetical protein
MFAERTQPLVTEEEYEDLYLGKQLGEPVLLEDANPIARCQERIFSEEIPVPVPNFLLWRMDLRIKTTYYEYGVKMQLEESYDTRQFRSMQWSDNYEVGRITGVRTTRGQDWEYRRDDLGVDMQTEVLHFAFYEDKFGVPEQARSISMVLGSDGQIFRDFCYRTVVVPTWATHAR